MLRDLARARRPEKPADALPTAPVAGFQPLTFREHRDCTVMPYRRREGKYEMGVFDASGACIPETLLRRTYMKGREWTVGRPVDFGPAASDHAGPAIWLGPLLDGFGHFLLESLARAWLARQEPDLPLVWSCRAAQPERGEARLKSWQQQVLDLLGVRNPVICVDAPARFERLIVPDVGYQIQTYFHPAQAEFLATVPHEPRPGRKLWLSRSRLDQLQNKSIPVVENRLADLGWTILHPQELSIREQMAELASAERIAGEEGSALHGIVLLDRTNDLRIDFFLRDPSREDGLYNKNYDTISETKGIVQKAIRVESEIVQTKKGKDVQKYSSNIDEYLEKLGEDPKRAARSPPKPRQSSAERINRLRSIRPATRYLEIGVAGGGTFLAVDIETKHAVDPQFRFDTSPHETEAVRFFPVTSDTYFTREVPADLRFDIIFLDGLHTFEQTLRDFCATMPHAHRDTVWIIDDVFPSDVFSALPSQEDAYTFRELHGVNSRLWHGDVYKCIFAINDFFPNFSFRTFEPAHGNPQTVVLNRPRPDFTPRFNDVEKISRLDYYGFWQNSALLNLLPEQELFDWVAAMMPASMPASVRDGTQAACGAGDGGDAGI